MSTKFEQLLDLLVNEETDKANELFHQIVVEKSREIYNNMIAEEAEEDESVEEAKDEEEDESVEESSEDDEDESVEEGFNSEESMYEIGGDEADAFVSGVEDHDAMGDGEEGGEEFGGDANGDQPATKDDIVDLTDALEELKAEFAALLAGEKHEEEEDPDVHGGELDDLDQDGDGDHDMQDHDLEDEEDADETFMREYRETVKKPTNSEEGSTNKASPVSKATGRPTTGATAGNIAQASKGADPKAGVGGVLKKGGEFVKAGTQNVGNTKAKGYSEKSTGHGAEKKGSGESSVNDKNTLPK